MARKRGNPNQNQRGAGANLPAPLPSAAPARQDRQFDRVVPRGAQAPDPATLVHLEEMHYFSGPLPPPHVLAGYKEIQADYPERLMRLLERQTDMAEVQATHRQGIEKTMINGGSARSWTGLILGAIIALAAIACGTLLIYTNHEGVGFAAIVAAIGTPLAAFVYSHKAQQAQLAKREREVPELPEDRR